MISAGFGLVKEFDMLPPYECSFSNRGKEEILEMSKQLNIQDNLLKLSQSKYDLVYLALGQDYLTALGDIMQYKNLGNEIIHFNTRWKILPNNFQSIDQNILVTMQFPNSVFQVTFGNYFRAKGALFLNYAIDMLDQKDDFSFINWWQQKKKYI